MLKRHKKVWKCLFYVILLVCLISESCGLRVNGRWSNFRPNQNNLGLNNDKNEFLSKNFYIITKFGFQKTDQLNIDASRGYIFGNITLEEDGPKNFDRPKNLDGSKNSTENNLGLTLALVNFAHFKRMYDKILALKAENLAEGQNWCPDVLSVVNDVAFDSKCNQHGSQDMFRRVPCPKNGLCPDEDQASNVFPNFQLTYRVQDKTQARFWYLILLNCHLTDNCTWAMTSSSKMTSSAEMTSSLGMTSSEMTSFSLEYDFHLLNGPPDEKSRKIFKNQFSSDEHNLFEIFLTFFILNFFILILEIKAYRIKSTKRGQFLLCLLIMQIFQLFLALVHFLKFAYDGRGFLLLKLISTRFLSQIIDFLIILLLIFIAKGWKIRTNYLKQRTKTLIIWSIFLLAHFTLYFWALATIDWWVEMGVFDVWQGWAILLVRVLAMSWFLVELRRSVKLEPNEKKQIFFLHFGSGFLVWFVYLPILGSFSSKINIMSRDKVITGLTLLANFVVLAILTHLFYPRSTNRLYFLNADSSSIDGSQNLLDDDDDENEYDKSIILMDDLDHVTEVVDDTSAAAAANRNTSLKNGGRNGTVKQQNFDT